MKSYEEQIYALNQELKMRMRELDKERMMKQDMEVSLQKSVQTEKNALAELHEINVQYSEALKKYERLEDRTSNIRAELVRLTKERNDAEAAENKWKLKAKVRAEKVKVLEQQLLDKTKEADVRARAGESLRNVNEEMRTEMDKMSAKLKHLRHTHVKNLEDII